MHDRVAAGADADEAAQSLRHRLIVGDATVRRTGNSAANAIELTWSTRPLVLPPSHFEEGAEVSAEHQDRPPVVAVRQSPSQPLAHGVPMNAEQTRSFFHRVAEVDLDESGIGTVPCHGGCGRLVVAEDGDATQSRGAQAGSRRAVCTRRGVAQQHAP